MKLSGQNCAVALQASAPAPSIVAENARAEAAFAPTVALAHADTALIPGSRQQWADAAWYAGHVLGAGSLLSRVSIPAAVAVATTGQLLTMGSRPWGRSPPLQLRYGDAYQQGADALWYTGHIMGLGTLVSHYCLPAAAAISGAGQLMVIVSRPLGRGQPVTVFAGRTAQQWADGLWYLGHMMATGSLLSRICLPAAIALAVGGQALVIVSRPLGRRRPAAPQQPADDSV